MSFEQTKDIDYDDVVDIYDKAQSIHYKDIRKLYKYGTIAKDENIKSLANQLWNIKLNGQEYFRTITSGAAQDHFGKKFSIPLEVQDILQHFVKSAKNKWDFVMLITGMEGCITGDTKINVNRNGLGRQYTIKQMYNNLHLTEPS